MLQQQPEPPAVSIRTTVPLVLVPVSVTDRKGAPVVGLTADDFALYDGAARRPHELEIDNQPLDLVILVQTNQAAGPAFVKLPKATAIIQPLLMGERGTAAVLSYSDEVMPRQDFSGDADVLARTIRDLRPDGHGSRMLDAVDRALRLLERRNPQRRRVILLIGENRDRSSETELTDVLRRAAHANVTLYALTYLVHLTAFTSRGKERFGDKKSPNYEKEPPAVVAGNGIDLIGGLRELALLGKPNAAEALAKATGGERFSFTRLAALEAMLRKVGDDLHSQYLLSFTPAISERGFHEIRVVVPTRPEISLRARPGYWTGALDEPVRTPLTPPLQ